MKEENRATGNKAVTQRTHAALELDKDWPALDEPQEQSECLFELCDNESEEGQEKERHGTTVSEVAPKPLRTGKSYAAATRAPKTRQSPNTTTPKPSFLPTHCLVPLTFEHRQQPRRKGKDRSLRSYGTMPAPSASKRRTCTSPV